MIGMGVALLGVIVLLHPTEVTVIIQEMHKNKERTHVGVDRLIDINASHF